MLAWNIPTLIFKGTPHQRVVLKGFSWKYLPCLSLEGLGGTGRVKQTYFPEQKDPLLNHLSVDDDVERVGPKEDPYCAWGIDCCFLFTSLQKSFLTQPVTLLDIYTHWQQ